MPLNLLTEPLIESDKGFHTLPGLLAAMAAEEVQAFPAMRPHQRPSWHMFLVQLAVLACRAVDTGDLPDGEEAWRQALRALTPNFDNDAPWHLIGLSRELPAFLQPPDPGGLKWQPVATPDALDMIITSRNHDVKREIAHTAAPQDWIFALVSLQTMEGFGGAGNYGIARMNGGSSSRVLLGLAPISLGSSHICPSRWWWRDVVRLLEDKHTLTEKGGKTLLWQEPWPEGHSLPLGALSAHFIEVCRRVRLGGDQETITAERSTSKTARVAAKEALGNTGDPWAPIHKAEGKSLTLGERDWTHELLTDLLFSNAPVWHRPPLAERHAAEATEPMAIVAEAFSRGNSKTDGFKSRVVPVPPGCVKALFGTKPAARAEGILADIAAIDIALRNGIATLSAGGDRDKVAKPHYARSNPARAALRRQADLWFFDELWARLAVDTDAFLRPVRRAFLQRLATLAREQYAAAAPAIPCPSLMRPKAEVRGRAALERGLHYALRDFMDEEANG